MRNYSILIINADIISDFELSFLTAVSFNRTPNAIHSPFIDYVPMYNSITNPQLDLVLHLFSISGNLKLSKFLSQFHEHYVIDECPLLGYILMVDLSKSYTDKTHFEIGIERAATDLAALRKFKSNPSFVVTTINYAHSKAISETQLRKKLNLTDELIVPCDLTSRKSTRQVILSLLR